MLNPQFVAGEHGLFGGHKSEDIRTFLKWKLKQDIVDVPCYSSTYGLENFMSLLKADISLAVNEHYILIVHIFLDGKPWTQQTILMGQIFCSRGHPLVILLDVL